MNNFLAFSVNDWLFFLEHRHKQEIQLGLERVKGVAARLGLLNWDAIVITVAGTNGKGSTVATLEAIYLAAGYQVASYTSPHLIHFNERIRINQQNISDDQLCSAFVTIENARQDTHLTYFEMGTLAALWYFKQSNPDIILLEVGMGGRLDATNIIDSDLAIITTVDLDHQDYLGHSIEAIGHEKAGILKKNKPFIYGDLNPPQSVLKQAELLNTPIYCLDVDYSFTDIGNHFLVQLPTGTKIELSQPNINFKAAAAAIMAAHCLQSDLPITLNQLDAAMKKIKILGRQQVVLTPVRTVFDVAHNPQAVSLLVNFIRTLQLNGNVHAIFSGLKDKDLCGLIKPMMDVVDFWYPALLSGQRAASESQLLTAFSAEGCFLTECFSDPLTAYQNAVKRARSNDLIIVYGSFLTVGAILDIGDISLGVLQ